MVHNKNDGANIFSTKEKHTQIIEKIRFELEKIVPKRELFRGRLVNWRVAQYLGLPWGTRTDGRKWDSISTIFKGERHLTQNDFVNFKKSLEKYFGKKSIKITDYIKEFINNPKIRKYAKQQWHLHNPTLKADFFSGLTKDSFNNIDAVSSYWFGFMGSDASKQSGLFQQSEGSVRDHKYRYDITIELSRTDRNLIEQFCDTLGLDQSKIKERPREKWGKIYIHAYVSFGCRDMIDDLDKLGFTSSKSKRKTIPRYVQTALKQAFDCINRRFIGPDHLANTIPGSVALTWLRGAYDGDGHSDRTELGSFSQEYLEDIRRAFKIKYPVRPHGENFYVLSLGARLYNAITKVCKDYDLGLRRKDYSFSESREAVDILKENLEDLNIDEVKLKSLVYNYRQYELVKMFSTTKETLRKLLNEWNIALPPNGYWSSKSRYMGDQQ